MVGRSEALVGLRRSILGLVCLNNHNVRLLRPLCFGLITMFVAAADALFSGMHYPPSIEPRRLLDISGCMLLRQLHRSVVGHQPTMKISTMVPGDARRGEDVTIAPRRKPSSR